MSEPLDTGDAGDAILAPGGDVRPSEPEAVAGTLTAADESVGTKGEPSEGDNFPRAYVERLRSENAEARVRAQRADEAIEELYQAARELATSGVLFHPDDLPDAEGGYLNERGLPDVNLMREAALKLADEKPYLARARGPVGQGPRGTAPDGFTLAGALREAAR